MMWPFFWVRVVWYALPVIAVVIALWALRMARNRPAEGAAEKRIADLELRVRDLLERVWRLEIAIRPGSAAPPAAAPAPPAPTSAAAEAVLAVAAAAVQSAASPPPVPDPVAALQASGAAEPGAPSVVPARLDLEQRIGARWATWVGIIAILFAISFFLRWSFENNVIGPGARVILGLVAGVALLAGGLLLHQRRDVPYLSEGLSGGGLATLYLSLYAAHAFYGFLTAVSAFAFMFVVTVAGAAVAVATDRRITAVLTVLGGLLTPVLLATDRPDERVLLGYLLVLDLLVLWSARSRSWPGLNRLAWAGTVILIAPAVMRPPGPPYPVARLVLLSALFLLFLAVPLARSWAERRRSEPLDLALVVGTAAAYFGAVYATLELWHPGARGPAALLLALLYVLVAAGLGRQVPDDEPTPVVHRGVAIIFLLLAVPLVLDGPWVTLAWAALGVLLLAVAPRVATAVAAWGGLLALLLASFRVLAFDAYWHPPVVRVWNPGYLIHLLVVGALSLAGRLAGSVPAEASRRLTPEGLRSGLWVLAALVLAVLLWREPSGLWPAGLLSAELLALGWCAKRVPARAFLIAVPWVALILVVRLMVEDAGLAREASARLLNAPLLLRVAGCGALALSGSWLGRAATPGAARVGGALSAAAGVLLLIVLSVGWAQHQQVALRGARAARAMELAGRIEWTMQVGLSVLWTLYAAAALAWGFVRSRPGLRYAALALLGLVIAKVFLIDLSSVQTVYRIVSFLILGVVLLGVSLLYQKARLRTS
jgi:uncharacterized membrane protein